MSNDGARIAYLVETYRGGSDARRIDIDIVATTYGHLISRNSILSFDIRPIGAEIADGKRDARTVATLRKQFEGGWHSLEALTDLWGNPESQDGEPRPMKTADGELLVTYSGTLEFDIAGMPAIFVRRLRLGRVGSAKCSYNEELRRAWWDRKLGVAVIQIAFTGEFGEDVCWGSPPAYLAFRMPDTKHHAGWRLAPRDQKPVWLGQAPMERWDNDPHSKENRAGASAFVATWGARFPDAPEVTAARAIAEARP